MQELPKLLTAFFVAALAWFVGSRITAAWDMRKKRGEFDVLLAKEFYTLIASFKSVAREWDAHLRLKPAANAPEMASWETARVALVKRALDAETSMESILLKLVTEGVGREGLREPERSKRQHSLSLFRVAFRSLRETIEGGRSLRQVGATRNFGYSIVLPARFQESSTSARLRCLGGRVLPRSLWTLRIMSGSWPNVLRTCAS